LDTLCKGKTCQKCNNNLDISLVKYPENIFYNGQVLINTNPIFKVCCDETDDLLEVYVIN
jgi:hypothetical protein